MYSQPPLINQNAKYEMRNAKYEMRNAKCMKCICCVCRLIRAQVCVTPHLPYRRGALSIDTRLARFRLWPITVYKQSVSGECESLPAIECDKRGIEGELLKYFYTFRSLNTVRERNTRIVHTVRGFSYNFQWRCTIGLFRVPSS